MMKIFVEDNILIKDRKCEAYSSDSTRDFIAPYSATAVERIKAAGMKITENRNEADAALSTLVKDNMFYIKPTYGTVSRFGLVANFSSMDQVGVWAKNLDDGLEVLTVIAGHDKNDGTTYPNEKYEYTPPERELTIVDFIGLDFKYADCLDEVSMITASAEYSANTARIDGIKFGHRSGNYKNINELIINSRSEAFSFEAMKLILMGAYVLSEGQFEKYYLKAAKIRRLIKQELDEIFKQADIVRAPDMLLAYLTGCPALYKPGGQSYITRNGQEGNFYGI
jgi:Asp-tRNA(Asn)/Glu-tRNA(Gln) amidotransferase A subunit family amidase